MDAEKASRQLERLQRDIAHYNKLAMQQIGDNNPNDSAGLRNKIVLLRASIQKASEELTQSLQQLATSDRVVDHLRCGQRDAKRDFDQVNEALRHREKKCSLRGEPAEQGTGERIGEYTPHLQQIARVDMNELTTVEAVQAEKARLAREVEQSASELHDAVQEFNALTNEQQRGLDRVADNVVKAHASVRQGTAEIKHARKYQ